MKKLLLTLISSLSILSTLSFATAQVKQASQYAKIETTEAGAPMVGNATELNFVCSGASSMVVTKSYTYNNTPVEIFNMALSSNIVFEKVLPAELGTRYDLTCKTDSKTAMTDSYKTPDFLPQAIRISADKTELNQGEKITIKSSTINGAFKYCDIYFDSNKAGILTGNMNTLTYSFDYSSMSAGSHNIMYKCGYYDNTVGNAVVNSNTVTFTRNADPVSPGTKMCTTVYKPVCGQPQMPICTKDMTCPLVMPISQTYSNKCELDRAGATYLYDGVCTSDEIPAVTACPTGTFNLKDTCQCPTGQVLTRVGQDSTGRDLYSCLSVSVATNTNFSLNNSSLPTFQFFVADGVKEIKGNVFFKAINNIAATIKDVTLKFTPNSILSLNLNNRVGVAMNDTATINGVNVISGTNLPLSIMPACVGSFASGCVLPSGSVFNFATSSVTYYTTDAEIKTGTLFSGLPGYRFVASKPTISFVPSTKGGLINGRVKIGDFSVSAEGGSISLQKLPLSIVTSGAGVSVSAVELRDESGSLTLSGAVNTGTKNEPLFNFTVPYIINNYSPAKFSVFAVVSGVSGPDGSQSVSMSLGVKNSFVWNDVSGAATGFTGVGLDYPTGSQTTVSGTPSQVNICPTGVFTNSDCTCQNGQQPTAIPSGTRIQQFTCDVKDTACTDVYKPVCGQPKTCNSSLGYCLDVMQKPQTYSNICALTSAGATYLYDGTCDGAKTNLIQKSSTTPPTIPNIPNNNDVDNGDDNNTGGVCVSLTANMRFRSRDNSTGGEVSKLQNFLISSGYLTGSATGYFGNATQAAVKSYQAANGLAVSGIVGQYTRAKIVDGCSNSNSAVDEPLPLGLPDSTSTSVQPKADIITKIDMRSVSGGFVVSPVQVTNGVKMTAEFKTNDFRFDGQYYVRLMYKNSSRQCILTGSFQPIANKTYKIERTSESACVLGGNIGDLSNVDYFEIAKQ